LRGDNEQERQKERVNEDSECQTISPTFFARIFRTNAFVLVRFQFIPKCQNVTRKKKFVRKTHAKNVGKIEPQFVT